MWPTFRHNQTQALHSELPKPQIKNHEQADKLNEAALNSENMQ